MERANPEPSRSRSSTVCSPGGPLPSIPAPRLSWGGLQIEPDEEVELKQHMWRLQLRKIQRVIKKLSAKTGASKSAQDSGNSAYVMICQYIHMWLVQKVECLKMGTEFTMLP